MTEAPNQSPVCLITGVGDGTGAATARRFADAGYRIAMLARNAERLKALEAELPGAQGYVCDVSDLDHLTDVATRVSEEMGPPEVLIHNAVAWSWDKLLDGDPALLEINFRVNVTALLYLARALAPAMIEAGKGVIVATGNTAAHRGTAATPYYAPTKAAQRILCQSMAHDLGPKGVHVAYVTIDALIDTPLSRPLLAPDKPDEFFVKPSVLADEIFHIAQQDRSAWSFDVEVRPFGEVW